MRVAAVIPARMRSTRLPRKPLLPLAGVPMILRVLDRARACSDLDRIIVATDSEEIRRIGQENGGEAMKGYSERVALFNGSAQDISLAPSDRH